MTDKAKREQRDGANQAGQASRTGKVGKVGKSEKAAEIRAAGESHDSQDEPTIIAPTEGDLVADTLETADQPTPETERARPRRAARKPAAQVTPAPSAEQEPVAAEAAETFETFEAVEAVKTVEEAPLITAIETDMSELEAQGFTADEALRLIDISRRLESSAEARESQAELKRLRFTQWLIERGILDEFSA